MTRASLLQTAEVERKPSISDRATLQRKARRARAILARRNFPDFCQQAWHVTEGAKPLEWNKFLQGLCEELQALAEGWLAANGHANPQQLARVIAQWERHGLAYEEGEVLVQNEIFNLAPGTLKSTIVMQMFPAWVWLHCPSASFAATSGVDQNVERDSQKHRELIESEWYRTTFAVTWTMRGKGSTSRWRTTAGGIRLSRPFLGGWSGVHVDFFLIDDPIDARKVWSDPARKEVNGKFADSMENRVNDMEKSIRIVTHQRVHPEDLSGYLRAKKKWTDVTRKGWALFAIPVRFGFGPGPQNDNETPELYRSPFGWMDPRTEKGELMPRFSPATLADELINKGSHGLQTQLDQNPEIQDGGWFSRSFFRFFRLDGESSDIRAAVGISPRPRPDGCSNEPAFVLPRTKRGDTWQLDWMTISIDATFGSTDEATASAVGVLVIGGSGMRRFVFDDATHTMTFLQTIAAIKRMLLLWPARRVLIELKANGPSVVETLRKQVGDGTLRDAGGKRIVVVVEGWNPGSESKTSRARAMLPEIEAGLWYLLDGAGWIQEFLGEVCVFPFGKRDDRIDSMSQVAAKYSSHNDAMRGALALARRT